MYRPVLLLFILVACVTSAAVQGEPRLENPSPIVDSVYDDSADRKLVKRNLWLGFGLGGFGGYGGGYQRSYYSSYPEYYYPSYQSYYPYYYGGGNYYNSYY